MMRAVSRFRVWLLVGAALVWLTPAKLVAQALPDRPGSAQPVRLTAPRIPPLPEAQWTDAHRALVATYGPEVRIGNAFRTLLNVPALVEAVMPFLIYITSDTTLSARHRELLILRTAWLAQNAYVWADHAPVARTAGVTAADRRRIAEGPAAPGWDPFEAILLRLADELFRNSSVSDVTWSALEARYDLYHMVDAVMTVNDICDPLKIISTATKRWCLKACLIEASRWSSSPLFEAATLVSREGGCANQGSVMSKPAGMANISAALK